MPEKQLPMRNVSCCAGLRGGHIPPQPSIPNLVMGGGCQVLRRAPSPRAHREPQSLALSQSQTAAVLKTT